MSSWLLFLLIICTEGQPAGQSPLRPLFYWLTVFREYDCRFHFSFTPISTSQNQIESREIILSQLLIPFHLQTRVWMDFPPPDTPHSKEKCVPQICVLGFAFSGLLCLRLPYTVRPSLLFDSYSPCFVFWGFKFFFFLNMCFVLLFLFYILAFGWFFEVGEHSDFICCVKSGSLSIGVILESIIDVYCSFVDHNSDVLGISIKHN